MLVEKSDGKLQTVINEEAVWRYLGDQMQGGAKFEEIAAKLLSDLVAWLALHPEIQRLGNSYVALGIDQNAAEANDLMSMKNVMLGIMSDALGKPTHFITTGTSGES